MSSFVYEKDEDGSVDLAFETDDELRQRKNVLTMLRTSRYGLKPSVAGRLDELLGWVDPQETTEEARKRVRRVLETMGLQGVPIEAVVEGLDNGWKLKLDVGGEVS